MPASLLASIFSTSLICWAQGPALADSIARSKPALAAMKKSCVFMTFLQLPPNTRELGWREPV
jgi:hypothetical protein